MPEIVENVYATALLEAVQEAKDAHAILESLSCVGQILHQNDQLFRFFCVPVIEKREKFQLAQSLFEETLHPYAYNFLRVLIEAGRFQSYFSIVDEFQKLYDQANGIERVIVRTAQPVSESQRQRLKEKVETMTGKQARMEYRVDKDLIGGIVVDIGDRRIDNSIKSRFEQLENTVSRAVFQKKGE